MFEVFGFKVGMTLIVLVGALAAWWTGNAILSRVLEITSRPAGRPWPMSRFLGRLLYWGGLAVVCVCILAGLTGPLELGPLTVERFAFMKPAGSAQKEALTYVRNFVTITSRPAMRWRGVSKRSMEYTVHNGGDRSLTFITLSYATRGGAEHIRLDGPFRSKRTGRTIARVPPDFPRTYFQPNMSVPTSSAISAGF